MKLAHRDTDGSASAGPENGKNEVEGGPPPPLEGQCVQNAADTNPPGPRPPVPLLFEEEFSARGSVA